MSDFYRNSEGYVDPTAYQGTKDIIREESEIERTISTLIHAIKVVVELAGFEVVRRITLKHRKSGRVYK